MTALLTFEHLGARANPAIDDLARIARKKPSSGALYCLESIGEAAFPALAKMANDSSYRGRSLAVDSIGGMEKLGTNEAAAVELLCSLSNEADQHMANNAIIALGKLALQPELALKTLVKFAGHERTSLNCNAITSIGRLGSNARPVASQLMVYLEDKNPNVREAATNAINRITPEFFATNRIVVRERHVIH
jgi:HEAT repeat protein